MYYVLVRGGQECFQITFIAISISKQVCGNSGAYVHSVLKGVFTASSHSLSLLDFREIHLKSADPPWRVKTEQPVVLMVFMFELEPAEHALLFGPHNFYESPSVTRLRFHRMCCVESQK